MRRFGLLVTSGTVFFMLLLAGIAAEDPRHGIGLALLLGAASALGMACAPVLTRTRRRRIALCVVTAAVHLGCGWHAFRYPELPGARWFGVGMTVAAAFWALLAVLLVRHNPGPPKGTSDESEPDSLPTSARRPDGRVADRPTAPGGSGRDGAVPPDPSAAARVPGR